MNWHIKQTEIETRNVADNGSRFLIGNGYLGVRGSLEEDRKEQLVAVNLAGFYDQVAGCVREPLNAPNPFFAQTTANGKPLDFVTNLPTQHEQKLNYRYGLAERCSRWVVDGTCLQIEGSRFVSMADKHLSGAIYRVTACNQDATMELLVGIDGEVWDLNGPHYSKLDLAQDGDTVRCLSAVQNSNKAVGVARRLWCNVEASSDFVLEQQCGCTRLRIQLAAGQSATVYSIGSIYTTRDTDAPDMAAVQSLQCGTVRQRYEQLLAEHCAAWDALWKIGEVTIEGDTQAMQALNYSLYHLNCIAPEAGSRQSIGARGLSGQTYKGAVFWDTEMFILDYFLYTQPEVAKSFVEYRIDGLAGALKKARQYGWQGAFYAWESQEAGEDACSEYNIIDVFTKRPMRTYFRDKQVHVSAAVVYALDKYIDATNDSDILMRGGAQMAMECARFYLSLLLKPLTKKQYEIHDVVGPDEYHERINNNGYTNRMAKETFRICMSFAKRLKDHPEIWQQLDLDSLLPQIEDAYQNIFVPLPDDNGIIEQFSGYFALHEETIAQVRAKLLDEKEYWGGAYGVAANTKVIKQADIVTMLEVFNQDYTPEQLRKNWEYYELRTEHGSSLSACMYALTACRFGEPSLAYPFFMKSAMADMDGGGKQWAGLLYIGGTHPAAAGGAWRVMAQGFAGLAFVEDVPTLNPRLPKNWKRLAFRFCYRGKFYHAEITKQGTVLKEIR